VLLPINELKRQNHAIADELSRSIARVLERGWYILGPEAEAFEQEFAAYCGVKDCVSLGNGTDALELALKALRVPAGAPVATVANAGMYGTTAIYQAGASPVFIDVCARQMTMDPASLEATLTPATAAIIVTHLYGRMAPMPQIMEIADRARIPVIEDCAQAHGAELDGLRAGAWGAIGCFSFYPTKNLGALGDGGAVVTNDAELAATVRQLRQYGWTSKYCSDVPGGRNSRLDEMQAAILRAKLPHLNGWNQRRREIACRYSEAFTGMPIAVPAAMDESYVAHLYVIRAAFRDELRCELTNAGIGTDVHYPLPDYRQQSVAPRLASPPSCPVTEECCCTVLTLPCFPEMTDSEIAEVIESVRSASLAERA
jgi:dTDP-4-amino-4,6-dideoxygalactose transaminase